MEDALDRKGESVVCLFWKGSSKVWESAAWAGTLQEDF